jgi:hypothetical protein
MIRSRALVALVSVFLALAPALTLAACGDDDAEPTTTSPPSSIEEPSSSESPADGPNALPAGFVECMAEQGYEVDTIADAHAAAPEVLQTCFARAHG